MAGNQVAEFRHREFAPTIEHGGVSDQKLQHAVVLRNRPCHQIVEIGQMRRQQLPAQPKIDHAGGPVCGESGDRTVRRQHCLALIDRGGAAVLADLAGAALHHHQNDVVIVDQRGGMPVTHRRQRTRRHGEARQRAQRQIDLDRVTVERINFDAENVASEGFAKGFGAVVPLKGVAHNAERRYFIVHRSPLLSFINTTPASPAPPADGPAVHSTRYSATVRYWAWVMVRLTPLGRNVTSSLLKRHCDGFRPRTMIITRCCNGALVALPDGRLKGSCSSHLQPGRPDRSGEASSITLHGTSPAPGKSQSFIDCRYKLALS